MRRVTLVAHPSPDLYGSDRVALATVGALVERGDRVVVALPEDGPLVPLVEAAGAEVALCRSPVLRRSALRPAGLVRLLVASVRSLVPSLRLLRSCEPDLVYVSTLTLPLWIVVARLGGRPCVCHVHEAESGVPAPVRRALALPLRLCGSVVANSEFSRDILAAALPGLRARCAAVPNPIPGPPDPPAARDVLADAVRLLYVGRLSPRKGPQVAIDAVGVLRDRGVAARLDLLGSVYPGCEWFEADLRDRVARARLDDRIAFLGFRPDVWPALAAADVVVVTSVADEAFGNTAVEAVLASRPVVVSDTGGLSEAVRSYRCAQLVPPGDPQALADAVEKVIAGWDGFRGQARADATLAAERHAPRLYGERLDAVLSGIVAGGDVGSAGR
jgi:glycosyltransferase involved in cell wall biosynthesis